MISLMQISETPDALIVSYPVWVGVAFLLIAAAALAWAIFFRARVRRRWAASLAVIGALWAGIYALTFEAQIDGHAYRVYGLMRYDHHVRWRDAADLYLEHGGSGWTIVLVDRQRRAFDLDVAELTIEQRDRVMAYMVDRMPESAFRRAPELMKRRSADSVRPASLFGDQQI